MSTSPNFWLVTDRLAQADPPVSMAVIVESVRWGDVEPAAASKGGPHPPMALRTDDAHAPSHLTGREAP